MQLRSALVGLVRAVAVCLIIAAPLPARADDEAARRGKPEALYVEVRVAHALGSSTSRTGQTFDATVAREATLRGATVYGVGAPVKGKVVYAKPDGKLGSPGILRLELMSIAGQAVRGEAVAWIGDTATPTPTRGSGSGGEPSAKGDAHVAAGTVVTFTVTQPGGYRYVPKHRLER